MLDSIYEGTGTTVCLAGAVQDISSTYDTMLSVKNCKNIHRYLSEDKYDVEGLQKLLEAQFGEGEIAQTRLELEERFGRYPETLRDYLTLLDAMISELYHTGDDPDARLPSYSRQSTFIIANNFHGPDSDPFKVYATRLIVPILQTLINVTDNVENKRFDHLKYIFIHVHEQNIASFLKFFGYWDAFGYSKHTKFSSSVRIELLVKVMPDMTEKFFLQFIYDDEVIKFPWCQNDGYNCPMDDFIEYVAANVILDYDYVDKFCRAEVGKDYTFQTKTLRL